MKKIFLAFATLSIILLSSCNSNSTQQGNNQDSAVGSNNPEKTKQVLAPIIKDYLALKNALVNDDGSAAATAGRDLRSETDKVSMSNIPENIHQDYMDIMEEVNVNAEHIGRNADKIAHQREHFSSLSEDINDLIALMGTPEKLYQDTCPMYNDKKGAIWISEIKDIKNPFYGAKMPTCGAVKKEY